MTIASFPFHSGRKRSKSARTLSATRALPPLVGRLSGRNYGNLIVRADRHSTVSVEDDRGEFAVRTRKTGQHVVPARGESCPRQQREAGGDADDDTDRDGHVETDRRTHLHLPFADPALDCCFASGIAAKGSPNASTAPATAREPLQWRGPAIGIANPSERCGVPEPSIACPCDAAASGDRNAREAASGQGRQAAGAFTNIATVSLIITSMRSPGVRAAAKARIPGWTGTVIWSPSGRTITAWKVLGS